MSIKNFESPRWTPEEYDTLSKYYPEGGWAEVHRRLPRRTRNAISQKARYLTLKYIGDKYRRFNETERAIITKYYAEEGSACRERLVRYTTEHQIRGFARRNGLSTRVNHKYTEEENELIRECYVEKGVRYCMRAVIRHTGRYRTEGSIRKQAERLGVSHHGY